MRSRRELTKLQMEAYWNIVRLTTALGRMPEQIEVARHMNMVKNGSTSNTLRARLLQLDLAGYIFVHPGRKGIEVKRWFVQVQGVVS